MELSRCATARPLCPQSRVRRGDRHGIICAVDRASGKEHGTRAGRSHPRNSAGLVRRRLRRGAAAGRAALSPPDARVRADSDREEHHAAPVSKLAVPRPPQSGSGRRRRIMAETTEDATPQPEQTLAYHILRYVPDLVRDEWVNIGVLVFNPETGERRLRLIEDQDEYNRVRRLHPWADEALLRALRDNLENRLDSGIGAKSSDGGVASEIPWQRVLSKWEGTLSNALQIAPQKGVLADDLDAEVERL